MTHDDYLKLESIEDNYWWFVVLRKIYIYFLDNLNIKSSSNNLIQLLDMGCGTGRNMVEFHNHFPGHLIYGLEISYQAALIAKIKTNLPVIVADAENLPFKNNCFDIIFSANILEYINNTSLFMKNINQVLCPSGYFAFLTTAFQFLYGSHDIAVGAIRRYRITELKKICDPLLFITVYFGYLNFFLFPFIMIFRFVKRCLKLPVSDYNTMYPWLNFFFKAVFNSEFLALKKGIQFPFGVSIFGIIHKKN